MNKEILYGFKYKDSFKIIIIIIIIIYIFFLIYVSFLSYTFLHTILTTPTHPQKKSSFDRISGRKIL